MRGRFFVVAAVLFFMMMCSVGLALTETTHKASNNLASAAAAALPASLDALYPPNAKEPVLLVSMHRLNAALAGIAVDISENDRQGAVADFETFRSAYNETASLVPEWKSQYPAGPVEELGKVMPQGAPGDVMAAVGRVGAVCHDCHVATMVPVQLKYRWPGYGEIVVHDPVTNADLDYAAFMQMLNASLAGVGVDLGQGQPENARAQLAALRSRMVVLRESCDACHDTERAYFVDGRIESLLAEMERALGAASPDPVAVASLSRRVGEESCSGCHMVHLPSAYSGFVKH